MVKRPFIAPVGVVGVEGFSEFVPLFDFLHPVNAINISKKKIVHGFITFFIVVSFNDAKLEKGKRKCKRF